MSKNRIINSYTNLFGTNKHEIIQLDGLNNS